MTRPGFLITLTSFILVGCTYMLEMVSTITLKEIHHLMSQDTAVYLRLKGLKDVQNTFLKTAPVTSVQEGFWFQQFLASSDYENLQKGISFANWLFETSPQHVFDNFFGKDVALTMVPKKEEKGFYGLLICEIQDPQKSLAYLDSFYRYILQTQGILREKKTQFAGVSQEVYYFQNTKNTKRETFILLIADSFLFLANDENLIQYAFQQLKQNPKKTPALFLQNPLVKTALSRLPEDSFLTFYADFGQILKTYPNLFQSPASSTVPDQFQKLVEQKVLHVIRDIQTLGFATQLTEQQLQFSATVGFQNSLPPVSLPSELTPIENYLTEDTFGVFNIRDLNQMLLFVVEHPKFQQIFQKMSVLFQGKNILKEIWPRLGEEVSLILMKQNAPPSGLPELPALHVAISGRPPETILQPIQQSLTTVLTAVSLEPKNPAILQYAPHEGVPIFTLSQPDIVAWGEHLLPCYTRLGDRLILSSSYASLKTLVNHYQQKKKLATTHPVFSYLRPTDSNRLTLLAPTSRSGFILYLPPVLGLLQRNQNYLLDEKQRNSPEGQAQWDFLYRALSPCKNLKFIQTQEKNHVGLTLTLEWI